MGIESLNYQQVSNEKACTKVGPAAGIVLALWLLTPSLYEQTAHALINTLPQPHRSPKSHPHCFTGATPATKDVDQAVCRCS